MHRHMPLVILIFSLIFFARTFSPASADIITLKDGGGTLNGRIIKEGSEELTVKLTTGGTATFPKSWIKDIKKEDIPDSELYTKQDIYFKKFEAIDPKDAKAQLALAEWCLKNSTPENKLADAAIKHFNTAIELDPNVAKVSGKDLRDAVDRKAGELYKVAETDFNIEQYLNSESMLLSIIAVYPESAYAAKSKDLMIKIWGSTIAYKILGVKDGLPDVAFSRDTLSLILSQMDDEEIREKYLAKCMDKARDYENRAGEVEKEKKLGYYRYAINCYEALSSAGSSGVRKVAESRVQQLLKGFFEGNPVPRDDAKLAEMVNYIKIIEDKDFTAKAGDQYFKLGESLYKKARKLKQPEKGQKAQDAFFCLSLANNFSKDGKIKQSSAELMAEAQKLERAKK